MAKRKKKFSLALSSFSIILLLILGVNAANVHNQENTSDKIKEEVSNIGVE